MLTTHPHLVPRLRMSRSYTSSLLRRVAGHLHLNEHVCNFLANACKKIYRNMLEKVISLKDSGVEEFIASIIRAMAPNV
jgi:hypothetical protein